MCIDTELDLKLAEQDAIANGVKIVNHSVRGSTRAAATEEAAGTRPTRRLPTPSARDSLGQRCRELRDSTLERPVHASGTSGDVRLLRFARGTLDQVVIQSGEQGCAFLKWDRWPLTSDDFDLYLVRMSDNQIVDASLSDQSSGLAPPTEELCYTNPGRHRLWARHRALQRRNEPTTRSVLRRNIEPPARLRRREASPSRPRRLQRSPSGDCWQNGTHEFVQLGRADDRRSREARLTAPDGVSTSDVWQRRNDVRLVRFPRNVRIVTAGRRGGSRTARPKAQPRTGGTRRRTRGDLACAWQFPRSAGQRPRTADDCGSDDGPAVRRDRVRVRLGYLCESSPDGNRVWPAVNPTAGFGAVAWSPDGSKIAFNSGAGDLRRLTPTAAT